MPTRLRADPLPPPLYAQAQAVRELLAYRLSSRSPEDAKREWYDIVEGLHALWNGVSDPYKHTIRAFLVHFHANILRHSSERFNFQNGSVGASVPSDAQGLSIHGLLKGMPRHAGLR
jgi:hypothetical protein